MKKIAVIGLLFGFVSVLTAQPLNKPTLEKTLETARMLVEQKDYANAVEWFEKAYEDSEDRTLLYDIAMLHYKIRDYVRAERRLATLLRRDDGAHPDAKLFYGKVLKMNGKYDEAVIELQDFIAETLDLKLKELAQVELLGAEMAKDLPPGTSATIEHTGKDLNNKQGQYSPVLVGADKAYFVGFEADDLIKIDAENTEFYAKIYEATKTEKTWGKPAVLDDKINRPGFHNSHVYVTPDGERMFFTRAVLEGNEVLSSKIFISRKGADGWQGANEVQGGVNGNFIAKHPVVGEIFGQEVLFFSSNIEGTGVGGFDIYYAPLKGNDTYGDAVNLGKTINTVGDEETPFYRDGTLYFSSNGLPSLGGFDIFSSSWNGTLWSEPQNMGKDFNTSVDDVYFMVDEEGYHGFLVSNREGNRSAVSKTCCNDIFEFELAKITANIVAGTFSDDKKPLLDANVALVEIVGSERSKPYNQSNKEGNVFNFPLGIEKSYRLIATKEGYFPDSAAVSTVGLKATKSFEQRFYLKKMPPPPAPEPEYDTISAEEPIELSNIYFDYDDDVILKESEQDLEFIYELMIQYPEMRIELGSHTDARGNDAYNQQLSQSRTESARRWLVRKGIARERIEAKGYGETKPNLVTEKMAVTNPFLKVGETLTETYINSFTNTDEQEAAHRLNRRTEFKIISGPTSITVKRARLKKNDAVTPSPAPRTPAPNNRRSNGNGPNAPAIQEGIKIHKLSSLYGKKPEELKGLPIMHFDERVVEFGAVKKGEKRTHSYQFTNFGDVPLQIDIVDHCDCTQAEYPRKAIAPGESGKIDIVFDSKDKDAAETIDINIILKNEDPANGLQIIETLQYRFDIEK